MGYSLKGALVLALQDHLHRDIAGSCHATPWSGGFRRVAKPPPQCVNDYKLVVTANIVSGHLLGAGLIVELSTQKAIL